MGRPVAHCDVNFVVLEPPTLCAIGQVAIVYPCTAPAKEACVTHGNDVAAA